MAKRSQRTIKVSKVAMDPEKELYCKQVPGGSGADLDELASLTVDQRREAIIHWLLINTGVRVSELCGIKLKGTPAYLGENLIEVLGKGGQERNVPVSENFAQYIQRYIDEVRPATMPKRYAKNSREGWLLYDRHGKKFRRWQIGYLVKKTAEKAGIKKAISPHSWRHRVASRMLMQDGANIYLVKTVLGHSSILTTEKYLHLAVMLSGGGGEMLDQM